MSLDLWMEVSRGVFHAHFVADDGVGFRGDADPHGGGGSGVS